MYNFETHIKPYINSTFRLVGNTQYLGFSDIKSIFDADNCSLTWVNPTRKDVYELVEKTDARLIVCDETLNIHDNWYQEKCFIIVEKPKLLFLKVLDSLNPRKTQWGIHPTAYVHPEAKIHNNSYIGAFTYIGICEIGEGSIIYGHCYFYDEVKIGKNVTIHAGTVIGADGFGYEKNTNGELEKFPHLGGVVIEDNVEIGANACIDKGTLGNTLIKQGAKIDNLVHIAHNVIIGKNTVVIANSMVGGSTEIGDDAWIAPSVSIMQSLKLGKKSLAGLGAVITKNIPDNETWVGNPAKRLDIFKEQMKRINDL